MNAIEKRDLLDALQEIEDLHQDAHAEDAETRQIDIVPSLALTLSGVGHEAILHEGGPAAFCPGCRVLSLVFKLREAIEALPVEPVKVKARA